MPEETLGWLIEQAISWECEACDLYTGLSRAFSSQDGVRRFWRCMADDETSHIATLRAVQASISSEQLAEPIGTEERAFVRAIDKLLEDAGKTSIVTLDDAYELAHQLEGSEINTVFRLVALDPIDDSGRRALLSAQFDEHTERLEEFGREFGPTVRRSISLDTG